MRIAPRASLRCLKPRARSRLHAPPLKLMTTFLLILLALGVAYHYLAVIRRLKRLTRPVETPRVPGAKAPGYEVLLPGIVAEVGQRLRDLQGEQTLLREQLSNERKLNSSIFDALESGLVLVGEGLGVVFANGAFRRWFSPRSSPNGHSILELCLNHEIGELRESVLAQQEGEVRTIEMEVYHEGRLQKRHFRVHASPADTVAAEGQDRVLFVFEDVSRLRELETIRRDFVANASHELRTPLSILKGYIENLREGAIDDREVAMRFLATMEKHCDRLTSLVKDLLTVSRLESFSFSLEPELLELEECASGIIDQLQPLLRAHGVQVELDCEPSPFHIRVDRFCFDQILFNLMENSVKHNAGRDLRITLHARHQGQFSLIEFRDNGVGIPQQDQQFVFNRFYRVTRGRTTSAEGTGLGLSIVKHAVEAHGGDVSVESRPGAGAIIRMRVPHLPESEGGAAPVAAVSAMEA